MSWSLRQSSWLRKRIFTEENAEWLALWPQPQKPIGILALASSGEVYHWWQRRGGAESRLWGQAPNRVRTMSGDVVRGRLALAGTFGLQLRSLETGETIADLLPNQVDLDCVTFSPDGALYAGGRDGRWWRWSAETLEYRVNPPADGVVRGHEKPIRALALHPQGHCLISAGGDHAMRVWDT